MLPMFSATKHKVGMKYRVRHHIFFILVYPHNLRLVSAESVVMRVFVEISRLGLIYADNFRTYHVPVPI